MKEITSINEFNKLDIRVGTIVSANDFPEAKNKAYKLEVDFGSVIGIKKTSAQITTYYKKEDLIGKQVLGIVNLPPRQIANFLSEFLVLGTYSGENVILIKPDIPVQNGDILG